MRRARYAADRTPRHPLAVPLKGRAGFARPADNPEGWIAAALSHPTNGGISSGGAAASGRERVVERVEDREGRAEPGQFEQLAHLRVVPLREHEGEAEAGLLGGAARAEEGRERRGVDELRVAEIDDERQSLVEQ